MPPRAAASADARVVFGVVSLMLWALILIVTLKYVTDHHARRQPRRGRDAVADGARATGARPRRLADRRSRHDRGRRCFTATPSSRPAISVLSAIEGLKLVDARPSSPTSLPLSLAILVGLFAVQCHGTGPGRRCSSARSRCVWFAVMALGGLATSPTTRASLAAFNPTHGVGFLAQHGFARPAGARRRVPRRDRRRGALRRHGPFRPPADPVGLARPRPAGAGAELSRTGRAAARPSRADREPLLPDGCPDWALLPLVLLATVGTVIASQAVISGAFSMTQQAMQLGLLPRMRGRCAPPRPSTARSTCPRSTGCC